MSQRTRVLAAWLLSASFAAAVLADETLSVRLSPAPRDAAMRAQIAGTGSARVTLTGNTLTIDGTFTGLATPATRAELRQGPAIALRGSVLRELVVTHATSGSLSGSLTLDTAARAAFDAGHLYIQVASESAPDGSVWGWLLPASAPIVRDR